MNISWLSRPIPVSVQVFHYGVSLPHPAILKILVSVGLLKMEGHMETALPVHETPFKVPQWSLDRNLFLAEDGDARRSSDRQF